MKYLSSLLLLILVALVACNKVADLPYYKTGVAPTLTASTLALAPHLADSATSVLVLNWTSPNYATDSSTVKYLVEIDSAGNNFNSEVTRTVIGNMSTSFTGTQLNEILLSFGYKYYTAHDMDVRVTSSYKNNNDRYATSTIKINMSPYRPLPKVALPSSGHLFITGSAAQSGWINPVPVPSQEFSKLDTTLFAGVFKLNGNGQYLLLPVNGDWGNKYGLISNVDPTISQGGAFYQSGDAKNFEGPAKYGYYIVTVDFQSGTFTVKPFVGTLPDNLYIVGDATMGGWDNNPPASQKFTRLNSSEFELTVPLKGTKHYIFTITYGQWTKYAVDSSVPGIANGGTLMFDSGNDIPAPATDGNYKIHVQFVNSRFTVK